MDSYRRQIQTASDNIAKFQRDKGDQAKKIADLRSKLARANEDARKATSKSTADLKYRDAARYESEIAACQRKIGDLESKIASEQKKYGEAQKSLDRETEALRKKDITARKKEQEAADKRNRELDRRQREQQQRERQHQQKVQEHERHLRTMAGRLNIHESVQTDLRRDLERLQRLPEKIRVLFLAANPLDQIELRLDEEARSIREAIRKSEHRDAVELDHLWAVRPLDLLQAINEKSPTVIHFSGHGSQGSIIFQADGGGSKEVSQDAIVQMMSCVSSEIKLVVFNSCFSRSQAEAVVQHVSAAIGMKKAIGDEAARAFAIGLYSAIGFGHSVKKAFGQARALMMAEDNNDADAPELFLADGIEGDQLVLVRPDSD